MIIILTVLSFLVCSLTLLVFVGGVIFLLWSLNNPDQVSGARQGWLERRSENDKQGW